MVDDKDILPERFGLSNERMQAFSGRDVFQIALEAGSK
jgi:hypothetical protein